MRRILLVGVALVVTCACAAHSASSTTVAAPLGAPQFVSPEEGAVLTFFPRRVDFEWRAVAGATTYGIEVDCYRCCAADQWCSDSNPRALPRHEVTATTFTTEFTFYQQPRTGAAPPGFQDPTTGQMVSGPGVSGPRAVYSPVASHPQAALKDRVSGEVTQSAVIDEDGRVRAVTVRRSLRADLDDSALATLKTWRFEPARKDGRAIAARIDVTMTYNLK